MDLNINGFDEFGIGMILEEDEKTSLGLTQKG